jgi:hypothetical protein
VLVWKKASSPPDVRMWQMQRWKHPYRRIIRIHQRLRSSIRKLKKYWFVCCVSYLQETLASQLLGRKGSWHY